GDCGCAVLGPPPATERYEPTARQRAFVATRDRRCRFPNCGQRVGWADLDHVIPHSRGGETDCANLCCLCRSHHRLKTHAPGWRFEMDPDGTLHVTTPSGVTRTTRPPGLRPSPPEPSPPEAAGRAVGPEPPPPEPADDPPPF
ncbi:MULTISPECIES: HNH endonuclease, partial [unclassified Modestobacter]